MLFAGTGEDAGPAVDTVVHDERHVAETPESVQSILQLAPSAFVVPVDVRPADVGHFSVLDAERRNRLAVEFLAVQRESVAGDGIG